MSLLVRIHVSASLKLILDRHLGPVNRRLVSPIELGCAVHERIEVWFVLILKRTCVLIVKHHAPDLIYILIGLGRANLL